MVDWEIDGIMALGVEHRPFMTFGKDFDLQSLDNEGFEAVFLATGAWKTPFPGIPGEDGRRRLGPAYAF